MEKNIPLEKNEKWTIEIKPYSSLFDINFKEIWQYKDLLQMFIRRDIITQYKQTILGPAWFIIQPILTTLIYLIVFGKIAKISVGSVPPILFYLAGITMWNYFSDCLNRTSNTFTSNTTIFGKVYFPRLIVPFSIVGSNLVKLGIQMGLFICIYLLYIIFMEANVAPNWYICLFPLLLLMMAGLSLGFGILISSLTTKYRDLTILFTFMVQLWMYATPIIYPLSYISSPKKQWIMALNPLTSIIETFKFGVLGEGSFNWGQLGYSFGFMVVLLAISIIVFNRVQRSFMDTI